MRGAMIALGAELIGHFSWVLYVLGAFLVYAGVRMLFFNKGEIHPGKSRIYRFASRTLRISRDYQGEQFFVRNAGRLYATPLFLVLLVVEITDDHAGCTDSIPAVFRNYGAILLLCTRPTCWRFSGCGRCTFCLAAGVIRPVPVFWDEELAIVLVFIGGKMIGERWLHIRRGCRLALSEACC